jgi:hypothetical protein
VAKSLSQRQAELLNEGIVDQYGEDRKNYLAAGDAPVLEQYMVKVVGDFLLKVQENIKALDKIDTGRLSESVSSGELQNDGSGVYSILAGYLDDNAAPYASFVNQGVRGFKSGEPSDSPFSFKSAWASKNGPMALAIQKWMKRNGIRARAEDQRTNLSSLQRKRESISQIQSDRNTAALIASRIKQRGLPKTDFFSSAVRQYFGDEFAAGVSKAFLQDVRVYIRQANALINKEQSK